METHERKRKSNSQEPSTAKQMKIATNEIQTSIDTNDSWTPKALALDGLMSETIANLRFTTSMTGVDLGRCIDASETLVGNVLEQVQSQTKAFLKHKGIDVSEKDSKDFLDTLKMSHSYSNYKTLDGQIRALKKHYKFIDAEEKLLGKTGNKESKFQYISLIETLKLILSNKEVMDYVKSGPRASNDEYFRSFEDGDTFKNHEFFKKFIDALGIHLYYDEFLVNNPLGSKTKFHKIAVLYFSLWNLPLYLRDWLGNVHVLAFAYHEDIKKYGMNEFLNPFFLELKLLETDNGVSVKINEQDYVLRAALLSVCADGLAAHEILGFLGPSAKYFCRMCYMSSVHRKECPFYIAPRRTKERHNEEAKTSELNKQNQSSSGVRYNTILNELKYFHCTENNNFDIMHQILEGQAPYDLKLVMAHFINSKDYEITADLLNERIEKFAYGPEEIKDKPSATLTHAGIMNVDTDHKLQERSVQTWCLLRIFPFLVADLVEADDRYLQHVINLNRINEFLFAPKFKKPDLCKLSELISDHLDNFTELFPNANVINKFHELSHQPECMQKSGPPRQLACFRYEAKHQGFKKRGQNCCNYKNIIKTMSNLSQVTQCYVWGTQRSTIRVKLEISATSEITTQVSPEIKNAAEDSGIQLEENLKIMDKIGVYGVQYTSGSFVAIDGHLPSGECLPLFGKIHKVVVCKSEVYLFCKEYISMYLEQALNAYCIEEGEKFRLVNVSDLCDQKPFSIWNDFSEQDIDYICLRHILF